MKITRQFKDGNLRRVFRKFVVGYFLISDLLQDVSLSSHSNDGSKIQDLLIPDKAYNNETIIDIVIFCY